MKKTIIILLIFGAILFAGYFVRSWFLPWPQLSSTEMLNKILKPTPVGTEIKELYYFNPSLGDGSMLLELRLTDNGMKEILERYKWESLDYRSADSLRSFKVFDENTNGAILGYKVSEFLSIELYISDSNIVFFAADGI